MTTKPVFLITGRPGTGKTTIIKQAIARPGLKAAGFYTEEIREGGTRLGFRLVTLAGRDVTLAHVDFSKRHNVGKYGVDIAVLENTGVPALLAAKPEELVIVDEIGRMELLSPAFREAIMKIVGSGQRMLGTIMLQPHPFADAIKRHPNVKLVNSTAADRDRTLADIFEWLDLPANPAAKPALYQKT